MEELLIENSQRFTIFPIQHPECWNWYKKLESLTWTAQEVDMCKDIDDWEAMPKPQREFYKQILAFFVVADEIVIENLLTNFMREIKVKEVLYFYTMQAAQECVHSEAYSIQVKTLIPDEKEQQRIFSGIEKHPIIKKKAQWVRQWMDPDRNTLGERLVGFAAVEGILFQNHFVAIQFLKEQNIMPGLVSYNEFISRDEGMHCSFACFLISNYVYNIPEEKIIHKILKEAVELVDEFINYAFDKARGRVPGFSKEMLFQYIRYFTDNLCFMMQCKSIYKVGNPFPQMTKFFLNEVEKTNFFELRPTQYQNCVKDDAFAFKLFLNDDDF